MFDTLGNKINVGDFLLYVTKTESPSLQFGWVEEIKDETVTNGHYVRERFRVKIAHAESDGTRKNKQVFRGAELDNFNNVIVEAGYRDTGRPSTAWLESYGKSDRRFLIHKPI